MENPKRSEVWSADLGIAAKIRPILVISIPYSETDYSLITVIPHTNSNRGTTFEVELKVPKLKEGAFNIQGIMSIPRSKFIRKITKLNENQMDKIEDALMRWLDLLKHKML
jgi:mRNA interferase MazF